MLIKFGDFIEFQNTEASKKAIEEGLPKELKLRFNQVKSGKSTKVVQTTISRPLYNEMKRHNLEKFKFFFNEKTKEILIRFDNSTKAQCLHSHKLQAIGITLFDKFITYTFNKIFDEKGIKSLSYICEYNEGFNLFLCTPRKEK